MMKTTVVKKDSSHPTAKQTIQPIRRVFREHLQHFQTPSFSSVQVPFSDCSKKPPPYLAFSFPIIRSLNYNPTIRSNPLLFPSLPVSQYLLQQLTMKGRKMYAPVVTEIYQQKQIYQTHLKKLEKIREERKNQLAFDANRLTRHQEIKSSKSRSFAHKYNEQHHEIAQENVKLLNKLEKVRPFTRYTSFSTHQKEDVGDRTTMTPFRKRRIAETEKENSRIFVKVKSASSSLSKDKFLKDYAKSQQIRTRIARYATQNNKICLKSQKFINMSNDKGSVTHYNHNDILKNRIENPVEALKRRRGAETERKQEEGEIFATEPVRLRNRPRKYQL